MSKMALYLLEQMFSKINVKISNINQDILTQYDENKKANEFIQLYRAIWTNQITQLS
jgi:hypothetical protein